MVSFFQHITLLFVTLVSNILSFVIWLLLHSLFESLCTFHISDTLYVTRCFTVVYLVHAWALFVYIQTFYLDCLHYYILCSCWNRYTTIDRIFRAPTCFRSKQRKWEYILCIIYHLQDLLFSKSLIYNRLTRFNMYTFIVIHNSLHHWA